MRIESLLLTQFRSIGDPGIEYIAAPGLNTLVGANNVGKSGLFAAIDLMLHTDDFPPEDLHWGRAVVRPSQVAVRLDSDEIDALLRRWNPNWQADMESHRLGASIFNQWLQDALFAFQTNPSEYFSIANHLSVGSQIRFGSGNLLEPSDLFTRLESENIDAVFASIAAVNFGMNLRGAVREIVQPKFKVFSDVRTRPEGIGGQRGAQVTESYTGGSTTDYLMNLMTGSPQQRNTLDSIKQHFGLFFPGWSFNLTGEQGGAYQLVFNREGHEFDVQQRNVGTGVVEVLTISSNLEGKTGSVLVIEEPELHLHPQSQRALQHLIIESSKRNQVFVLTHSPYFIDPNHLAGVSRMWMPDDRARIAQFPELEGEELALLRESFRELRQRELLSARAALLVEGQTEEAFLQSIGPRIDLDVDAHGISVVSVGGQDRYMPYLRLVEEM